MILDIWKNLPLSTPSAPSRRRRAWRCSASWFDAARMARAGDIASALGLAPATLSLHLSALRHAGLVRCEAAGRERIYRAAFERMHGLVDYLTETAAAVSDDHDTRMQAFRRAQAILERRGRLFVGLPLAALDRLAQAEQVRALGRDEGN